MQLPIIAPPNILPVLYYYTTGPLEVCCGDPKRSSSVIVTVPSDDDLAQFTELNAVPPKDPAKDPAKYALRLLSVFFTDEELAESNCMRAEERKLLNQAKISAIRDK